jgi:glucan 1,3-beta-glucosidase
MLTWRGSLHWQVSQATSLMNVRIEMGTGSAHQGMFMENGSGGFMGDMVINGGKYGIWVGNQQFTVRNVTFNNAATAVSGCVLPTGVVQRLIVSRRSTVFGIGDGLSKGSALSLFATSSVLTVRQHQHQQLPDRL